MFFFFKRVSEFHPRHRFYIFLALRISIFIERSERYDHYSNAGSQLGFVCFETQRSLSEGMKTVSVPDAWLPLKCILGNMAEIPGQTHRSDIP